MKKLSALALGSVLSLTGCAAIVADEAQTVYVDSSPSQALFVISDNYGRIAATGTTPSTVTLPKSDGTYLGWLNYQITFPELTSSLLSCRSKRALMPGIYSVT